MLCPYGQRKRKVGCSPTPKRDNGTAFARRGIAVLLQMIGADAPWTTVGPVDSSRVRAVELQVGPSNEVLAQRDGSWCVADNCYTEGPFRELSLINGVLWGDDLALARLDLSEQIWRLIDDWSDYFRAISWRAA